jgi:hypothetical protein
MRMIALKRSEDGNMVRRDVEVIKNTSISIVNSIIHIFIKKIITMANDL